MTLRKGRMIYVPPVVLDEVELIQQSKNIDQRSDAFNELVKYSRVGREAEQIMRLDFGIFKKKKGNGGSLL